MGGYRSLKAHSHGCKLGVDCWSISRLTYGKVEQREKGEDVCKGGIEAIIIRVVIIADVIELGHFIYEFR